MFDQIKELKNKTIICEKLNVCMYNKDYVLEFHWNLPISQETINFPKILEVMPSDYKYFLTYVANGATLYHEVDFGQWGYWLYSIEEIIIKQEFWKKYLLPEEGIYLPFGEMYGENSVLAFDLNSPKVRIVEATSYDKPEDWYQVAKSFEEMTRLLIQNNGEKFWEE